MRSGLPDRAISLRNSASRSSRGSVSKKVEPHSKLVHKGTSSTLDRVRQPSGSSRTRNGWPRVRDRCRRPKRPMPSARLHHARSVQQYALGAPAKGRPWHGAQALRARSRWWALAGSLPQGAMPATSRVNLTNSPESWSPVPTRSSTPSSHQVHSSEPGGRRLSARA